MTFPEIIKCVFLLFSAGGVGYLLGSIEKKFKKEEMKWRYKNEH